MGYSCAKAAMDVVHTWQDYCYKKFESQNTWTHNGKKYFFEIGRENSDGAITGTIWKFSPDGVHVTRSGNFRIESDGTISKAPKFLKKISMSCV